MLNSFEQTVATPRKCPGRKCAFEILRPGRRPAPTSRTRRDTAPRRPARTESRRPPRPPARCVLRLVPRVAGEIGRIAELARVDEDARDHDVGGARARPKERGMPRMKCAHRRHERDGRERPRSGCSALPDVGDRAERLHGRVTCARARYNASRSGADSRIAARCASTVAQSPRAMGPVSSKPLSIVRRISGQQRLGRCAGVLEQPRRPRDTASRESSTPWRRRRDRARVIHRGCRTAAGRAGRPARCPRSRASLGLGGDRRPGAVESARVRARA